MHYFEILLIGIGLSMDALAVSVSKGLSLKKVRLSHMLKAGLWFGGFQFLMPVIGWLLGGAAAKLVDRYDHWIAFILLALIGGNMIREAIHGDDEDQNDAMNAKIMFLLAVATSIDALAVGVTFAFMDVHVIPASLLIGCTTFIISAVGIRLGGILGSRFEQHAQIVGGIVLIVIGARILLTGIGWI
ncbi:MAG: manganese efflux pump MntP family protein [Eubacterium sp.]|jgi:putative Mn2+ efflux pump MntP|nr:manganese efflux pump MntP family protein [Eubacterium sp.]MCH4047553.1 manganese efflux pump MntP family protein [Eubacterium sp.]MCH4078324.1 manganese efflux pump MntP family protein [Eubacterium sp.]MCH4109471.1 manganese efflux pump MntP family protein [Eubacterium sp.]MCI1307624.1 manganese efflux pump MntP family protein [Eubacterium sp.]